MIIEELPDYNAEPGESLIFCPDLSDPIDVALVDYRELVQHDQLPDDAVNRRFIAGLREQDPYAPRGLLRLHKGLVAAVAYPFKGQGIASIELLTIGGNALLFAAKTHRGHLDFADYAVECIEEALSDKLPDVRPVGTSELYFLRPLDRVVNFVGGLKDPDPNQAVDPTNPWAVQTIGRLVVGLEAARKVRVAHEVKALEPRIQEILPLLHLQDQEIRGRKGYSVTYLDKRKRAARDRLQLPSRVDLALIAHEAGVQFDLMPAPPIDQLSRKQRMAATRMNRTDEKIAEEIDLSKPQVRRLMKSLFAITGARTRTELALMARVYGFGIEPGSPEEVGDMFEGYKPSHRIVLENLHLPIEEIVEKSALERDAVDGVMHRCEEKTGTNKRVALALELQRRGVKYDTRKPKGPLAEVLSFAEWQVAESLTLSNEEIAEVTKYDPDSVPTIVYRIRLKIGARTRTEIALMM